MESLERFVRERDGRALLLASLDSDSIVEQLQASGIQSCRAVTMEEAKEMDQDPIATGLVYVFDQDDRDARSGTSDGADGAEESKGRCDMS